MNQNKFVPHQPGKNGLFQASLSQILIPGSFLILTIALIVIGCDSMVDQKTDGDAGIVTSEMAESLTVVAGSAIECINPDEPEDTRDTESKITEWGNPSNPFEKTVTIEYYNTLEQFVFRLKSTEAIADVLMDDESIKDFDGSVSANTWQEFTFELEEDWKAGDIKVFEVKVVGKGPAISFEVAYTLVGECEDQNDCACDAEWVCSSWSVCTANGIQTRVCEDQNDCTCDENRPAETRSCDYVAPCEEAWACSEWSTCSEDGTQARVCDDQNSCGSDVNKPAETQSCEYVAPCEEAWACSAWSTCSEDGTQARVCDDQNSCGSDVNKPAETQSCEYVAP